MDATQIARQCWQKQPEAACSARRLTSRKGLRQAFLINPDGYVCGPWNAISLGSGISSQPHLRPFEVFRARPSCSNTWINALTALNNRWSGGSDGWHLRIAQEFIAPLQCRSYIRRIERVHNQPIPLRKSPS